MAEGLLAAACFITPMLGFAIFYIVALAMSPDVSEIGCGKVMWYTLCIHTGCLCLSIPMIFFKRKQLEQLRDIQQNLQDPKDLANPASKSETCISCLLSIGMMVNNALLLDQVLNISSECQAQIESHSLFWHAAQIQAYSFLAWLCLFGFCCCCGCCLMCIAKKAE